MPVSVQGAVGSLRRVWDVMTDILQLEPDKGSRSGDIGLKAWHSGCAERDHVIGLGNIGRKIVLR